MAKKSPIYFRVESCQVKYSAGASRCLAEVTIEGTKKKPSKRLVFRADGLKVLDARALLRRKNQTIELNISRINHVKSFGEVRLHSKTALPPGFYVVKMTFELSAAKAAELKRQPSQAEATPEQYFPAIGTEGLASQGLKLTWNS